jgi:hypothetical protein
MPMAKQLGRWRMTDELRVGARDGAFLANPIDARAREIAAERRVVAPAAPRRPARPVRHIHVHLPAPAKTRDQSGRVTRDAPATAAGYPISTGDVFSVSDCGDDGFALRRVRTSDVDKDGMPSRGDAVFGASDPPGAATNLDQLRRRVAPRPVNDQSAPDGGMSQLRDMQKYLDAFYTEK